jgi:hypothetical protein
VQAWTGSSSGFVLVQVLGLVLEVVVLVVGLESLQEVSLLGVHRGSFGRKDVLDYANPTFEQMARHWFYSFGTNPSAELFVRSHARF